MATETLTQLFAASPTASFQNTDIFLISRSGVSYGMQGSTILAAAGGGGGAVSSVSNSDSSLTVSPTTGAVVASLNVAHGNTWTAAQTLSLSSAAAFAAGPNGNTNPCFRIVTNTASAATGLAVTGNAAAAGVTMTVLSSGTDESLFINPKGSGAVIIPGAGSGVAALRLRATDGQLEIEDGSGTHCGFLGRSSSTGGLVLSAEAGDLQIYTGGSAGDLILQTVQAGHTVRAISSDASNVVLTVRGAAAQSGNLQEWQDSTPTVLAAVKKNGAFAPSHLADSAAANDTLYYSTTANKLVYKDSGGTVIPLY